MDNRKGEEQGDCADGPQDRHKGGKPCAAEKAGMRVIATAARPSDSHRPQEEEKHACWWPYSELSEGGWYPSYPPIGPVLLLKGG